MCYYVLVIDVYTLHFDGSCWPNPGGTAAYGFILKTPTESFSDHSVISNGPATSNNVAEYVGLSRGLEKFLTLEREGTSILQVYGDSQLVIKQMNRKWKIKDGLYKKYAEHAVELVKKIRRRGTKVDFNWIRRDKNTECDVLSKLHLGV